MWYKPVIGNSWMGPVAVHCHRGPSVWLHTIGDIKKVAACKIKPYELVDRESIRDCQCKKHIKEVMLEYGLEDVDKLIDPEREKQREAMKQADVDFDIVGANYLKVVNSVSFDDVSIYTVELPVSGTESQRSTKQKKLRLIISLTMMFLRKCRTKVKKLLEVDGL